MGCQSAKPKQHLKGKRKMISLGLGPGGPKLLFMQKLILDNVADEHVDISAKVFNEVYIIQMLRSLNDCQQVTDRGDISICGATS